MKKSYYLKVPKGHRDLRNYKFESEEHARKWISQGFCKNSEYKVAVRLGAKTLGFMTYETPKLIK